MLILVSVRLWQRSAAPLILSLSDDISPTPDGMRGNFALLPDIETLGDELFLLSAQ
jgi:hypothetical protein